MRIDFPLHVERLAPEILLFLKVPQLRIISRQRLSATCVLLAMYSLDTWFAFRAGQSHSLACIRNHSCLPGFCPHIFRYSGKSPRLFRPLFREQFRYLGAGAVQAEIDFRSLVDIFEFRRRKSYE